MNIRRKIFQIFIPRISNGVNQTILTLDHTCLAKRGQVLTLHVRGHLYAKRRDPKRVTPFCITSRTQRRAKTRHKAGWTLSLKEFIFELMVV